MTYYEDIKRIRCEQKINKGDLSKLSGVSREYIGKIESGASADKVTYGLMERIAKALGKRLYIAFIDREHNG